MTIIAHPGGNHKPPDDTPTPSVPRRPNRQATRQLARPPATNTPADAPANALTAAPVPPGAPSPTPMQPIASTTPAPPQTHEGADAAARITRAAWAIAARLDYLTCGGGRELEGAPRRRIERRAAAAAREIARIGGHLMLESEAS